MTYDPTISAARRAAKQLARSTGAPYQASLDTVARNAGRSDWDAFLAFPATLPEGEDLYANGEEHRHNQTAILITGAGTLPAALTVPFILTHGREMPFWGMVQIMAGMAAFWTMATFGALMFFEIMSVHPHVPEVGENGTRMRNASRDLAKLAIGLSAAMLVIGILTRGVERANFPLVATAAGMSVAIGGVALLARAGSARRILTLIALNGTLVAGFATAAMMPR